jgi:hypothetical protein
MKANELIVQLQRSSVEWVSIPDSPYVFNALFHGTSVALRLNDFPDEPLYTLIFDGTETDLDEFPSSWTLPRHRANNQQSD